MRGRLTETIHVVVLEMTQSFCQVSSICARLKIDVKEPWSGGKTGNQQFSFLAQAEAGVQGGRGGGGGAARGAWPEGLGSTFLPSPASSPRGRTSPGGPKESSRCLRSALGNEPTPDHPATVERIWSMVSLPLMLCLRLNSSR